MNINSFTLQNETVFHSDAASIDEMEAQLASKMPIGYRDFMTRFGEGVLAAYIRVYPPHQILSGDSCVDEWRKRIDEYWFWDDGKDILTKNRALESIIVADTMDGDEIIFHPLEADVLYVLPRNEEVIYIASEDGLFSAIQWLLTSGVLTDEISGREFEPIDGLQSNIPSRGSIPPNDDLDFELSQEELAEQEAENVRRDLKELRKLAKRDPSYLPNLRAYERKLADLDT